MARHNWAEIKSKFLWSKAVSVLQFLKEEGIKRSWNVSKQTTGWTEDKLKLIMEAKEEARDELKSNLVTLFKPSEKEIAQAYEAVFTTLRLKAISNYQKIKRMPDGTIIIPPDVNVNEQKAIWEVIKAERWEPTKFNDRWDFIPETEDDEDDVTFFLPDNQRELWEGK